MITNRNLKLGLVALLALIAVFIAPSNLAAQTIPSVFAGRYRALNFAYGLVTGTGPAALQINIGNAATGAQTVTLDFGQIQTPDGVPFTPLAINAPVSVGGPSNLETVTPSAVSCTTPLIYASCTFTATFSNTHGRGEPVTTGTYGLQEAINYALQSTNGGTVVVDKPWALRGGTTSLITAAAPFSQVVIEDTRTGDSFYSEQPTTINSLAVPTTLTGTTAVFSGTGTWTNAAQYLCVTYVDALGGEGPCSLTYNQTPSANTSLTITAPAASTGAVGWRAYGGASYNATYLLPITTTACTLTTLESIMPACAIGSNGTWAAIFVNTTTLRPNATVSGGVLSTPTVNISNPQPAGHTTFGYQPSGTLPEPFQTHYAAFPAYGSLTSGQVAVLGSVNLPAGFLNVIGRTVRFKGKLNLGSTNTATLPTLNLRVDWVGGTTAGVGVTTCADEGVALGATKTYLGSFECTLTTNAVGATAVGTVETNGYLTLQASDISANAISYADSNTSTIGSLGLFAQDTVSVLYTSTTNATAAPTLLSLDVEVLQ